MRHTFKVYERLKREQHIHTLFQTGKACSVFPVKFIYRILPRDGAKAPLQAGFSVPKKKFRKSVDRHKVRRFLVEAWRLNKHCVADALPEGYAMHVFLIFIAPELPDFSTVEKAVGDGIKKLSEVAKQHSK